MNIFDTINKADNLVNEAMEPNAGEWRSKDGVIRIAEMSIIHIKRCIKLLEDKGFISAALYQFYLTCPEPRGDGAMDAFDSEFDSVVILIPSTKIDELKAELSKRKEDA